MRRIVALLLAVLCGGATLTLSISTAFAGTITAPTGTPFAVPGDAAGNPVPFTITATGFAPDANVFVEQCDGTPPTAPAWDPTTNCDLGASPAPALADANGAVTFDGTDPNHVFHAFKGASPQGLFNCLAPGQASPGNGLPDFTNCQVRVSTNNSAGTSDQAFLTMTLPAAAVGTAPGFTGTPPAGTVGTPYSFAFTGITGSPAPTFSVSPTTIAGGITISPAGVLSGTPTTAGSTPITVTATNGVAPDAVKTFTIVIAAVNTDVAPDFTGTPSAGTVGAAYSFAFTGITGSPAPTFSVSPTTIAGGITISPAGVLSGTPTTAGSTPITVTATNGVAPDAVKTFTIVIAPANTDTPPDFTGTPTAGTVGVAYNFAFTGITGSPAPTFTLDPATVAGGVTISVAGVLSGTPTTAGSFPITVTATNGVAPDAVKTGTLVIAPANTDTPPDFTGTPGSGTVGAAYSFAFTGVTGSPAPTFAVDPVTVAGGITISSAGVLSGTPTTAGAFPITVTATNGVAPDAVKTFTIDIAPANTDTAPDFTGTPPAATVGAVYDFSFTGVTGSPAPTFTLDPATVAGGITISPAGVLSGTPTTEGSFPITVTAANGIAPDAVKTFTLVVNPAETQQPPECPSWIKHRIHEIGWWRFFRQHHSARVWKQIRICFDHHGHHHHHHHHHWWYGGHGDDNHDHGNWRPWGHWSWSDGRDKG